MRLYVDGVRFRWALCAALMCAGSFASSALGSARGEATAQRPAVDTNASARQFADYTALRRLLNGPMLAKAAAATVTGTITAGGSPVTVTISAAGDDAALTFSGTAGQRVFVKTSNSTIGSAYSCYQTVNASILNPDGSTLTSKSWLCNPGDYMDTVTLPTHGDLHDLH